MYKNGKLRTMSTTTWRGSSKSYKKYHHVGPGGIKILGGLVSENIYGDKDPNTGPKFQGRCFVYLTTNDNREIINQRVQQ